MEYSNREIMRRLPINVVENDMAGNTLMSMTIQLLTPTLWDDVVEERSVGGVCGYPFCKNQIAILKKKRRKYGVSFEKSWILNIEGRDAAFVQQVVGKRLKSYMHL